MYIADTVLWQRWRESRDAEAFEELVRRYSGVVFGACKRVLGNVEDAEETAQECFLELMSASFGFKSSLGPLLHTVAVRRSLDRVKAERRRRGREKVVATRAVKDPTTSLPELIAAVDEAIASLPASLRLPIVLRFIEGRTVKEVADQLGIGESTVRHRVARGIEKVRRRLAAREIVVTAVVLGTFLADGLVVAAPRTLVQSLARVALAGGAPVAAARSLGGWLALAAACLVAVAVWVAFSVGDEGGRVTEVAMPPQGASSSSGLEEAAGPPRGERSVTTTRGARTLAGIVRDAWTLEPLLGARVELGDRETVTGVHGAFELRDLLPSTVAEQNQILRVSAAGSHAQEQVDLSVALDTGEPLEVELVPFLKVRCVDGSGEVVPGVDVYLAEEVSAQTVVGATLGPLRTDAAGLAAFALIPSHESVWRFNVYARLPGQRVGITNISFPSGSREPISPNPRDIVLVESDRLEGTVRVPEGFARSEVVVAVAWVSIQDPLSPLPLGASLETDRPGYETLWGHLFTQRVDEVGRFVFPDVLPHSANLRLYAHAPGLGSLWHSVGFPWPEEPVEISLSREGILEGRAVYSGGGGPAAGVSLTASPSDGRALDSVVGPDGSFRLKGLPEDLYDLKLSRGDSPDAPEWVMAPRHAIHVVAGKTTTIDDLELETGTLVRGQIRDAATGYPLEAAIGAMMHEVLLGSSQSDAAGRFEIRVPSGELYLYLASHLEDYAYREDQHRTPLVLAVGERMREGVDFHLEPRREAAEKIVLARVEGRVVDESGIPLPGVIVKSVLLHDAARPILSLFQRRTVTDDAGRFALSVPAGIDVHVRAGGGAFSTAQPPPVLVGEDETHVMEALVLKRGDGFLSGRAVDENGRGLPNVSVWISSKTKDGPGEAPLTDEEGFFRVENLLQDETLRVTLTKPGLARRTWHGVALTDARLEFTLYPLEGALYEVVGDLAPKHPETLVGRPAPALDVERWVPPGPELLWDDGTSRLLVLAGRRPDWPRLGVALEGVALRCAEFAVEPVLVVHHDRHPADLRELLRRHGLSLRTAVDRFIPRTEFRVNAATGIRFGLSSASAPLFFLIDGDGIVIRLATGWKGAESIFEG